MSAKMTVRRAETSLTGGEMLRTPWWEIEAACDGPTLMIIAAQHGNEVQGTEVIRRFAAVCADRLVGGTALLVPFGNILAIRHRRNSIKLGPEEKHTETHTRFNMNGQWPGHPDGNDIQRLAHSLYEALVVRATHVIDLHCWNKFWATATLATDDGDGDSRAMGEAAGTRFTSWRPPAGPDSLPAQIRAAAYVNGAAVMAMEFAGQYCVYEREVQTGVRAMTNIAKVLGMLDGEPEIPADSGIEPTEANTTLVEAPCRGLFVQEPGLQLEDPIDAGQRLGHILRDDDLCTVEITSPVGGWLWRFGRHQGACDVSLPDQHPYAAPGDPLASVVSNHAS